MLVDEDGDGRISYGELVHMGNMTKEIENVNASMQLGLAQLSAQLSSQLNSEISALMASTISHVSSVTHRV
eukprot:SAG11_NODE_3593_length_2349_cov_2.378222_1_plen_70_part_10